MMPNWKKRRRWKSEVQAPPERRMRFGRKQPPVIPVPRVLRLGKYRSTSLVPPTSVSYVPDAAASLSKIYLNDTEGDCVVAGIAHVEGVLTGNEPESPLILTDAQIEAFYVAACGPGDQGCDVAPTLDYWMKNGIPIKSSHKPAGFVAVDPTNQTEVMTAIWLFENAIPGINLPDAWVNPFPTASGFTWDVAGPPDPDNGHCPPFISYSRVGVITSTWAMTGTMTWAAVAYYCAARQGGELYTVISQDSLDAASGKAPNGLDWQQIVDDFNAMGGSLVYPDAQRHHHHHKKA